MPGTLLLAIRYIVYYRGRTAILVAAIALTAYLPLATRWTIGRFEDRAMQRARTTPLVVGVKGSRFGLTLHALYFRGESPISFPQSQLKRIEDTKLARAIPLFARFRARGFTIVGTTGAYTGYRGLTLEYGQPLQRLGDCLLGSTAARTLGLGPGDRLLSESENMFDLSGPSPLNMRVTGVLRRTGTADDEIVLTDLRTTWIIQGIGHGHTVRNAASESSDHQHSASRQNLPQYAEVTDENLGTFHFHGRSENYPLSAIIAIPDSPKSEAILIGKFLSPDEVHQIVRPVEVIEELMQVIGQVRRLFDLGMLVLALATLLLVILVLMLSIRLRERELRTMYLLGCSRSAIVRLLLTEQTIVLAISVCLAVLLAAATTSMSDSLIGIFAESKYQQDERFK